MTLLFPFKAYILKTKNDRNQQISDFESWHIGGHIWLRRDQRDAQKHCFIYPRTTIKHFFFKITITTIGVLHM